MPVRVVVTATKSDSVCVYRVGPHVCQHKGMLELMCAGV